MKIHLLRRESVTPMALYIARRDEQPESFDRQLEFGTLLLYREREYRSMYASDWLVRGVRPARDRRAAKALIAQHGAAIDAWLATRDQPYEGEAAAFFWLREAGEEL